ncbi:MAG: hypothetical protein LDL19_00670 [Thiobacillus sp.]|nr:hypothetical protein [Thiobacillus sp.]
MFYRTNPLAVLVLLAGCASTQQAAVEPVAVPVPPVAEPAPVPQAAVAQAPERERTLVVADVTPAQQTSAKPAAAQPTAAQPAADPYHYQCMLAWSKGLQGALAPWTQTAQACDTRTPKP